MILVNKIEIKYSKERMYLIDKVSRDEMTLAAIYSRLNY